MTSGPSSQPVVHAVGSRVWIRDEAEGWVKAEVTKLDGAHVVVALEEGGQERRVAQEEALLQNNDARGVEVRHTCQPTPTNCAARFLRAVRARAAMRAAPRCAACCCAAPQSV